MPTIILSYRREDTAWIAGRIHDRLRQHYGPENVFMDIDSIPFGLDFREHLQATLARCDILLAIVGPRWSAPGEDGKARLFEDADWVRLEIETALAKKVPVIPVLIDGSKLPRAGDLPGSVRDIVFRQAADLDAGRDFHPQMDRLIAVMDQLLAQKQEPLRSESLQANTGADGAAPPLAEPFATAKTREAPVRGQAAAEISAKPSRMEKLRSGEVEAVDATPGSADWKRRLWTLLGLPSGRIGARAFALALIASFVAMNALVLGAGLPFNALTGHDGTPPIVLIFPLAFVWIAIALGAKRLHDLDWPAWTIAVPLALAIFGLPLLGIGIELWTRIFFSSIVLVALLLLSPLGWMRGTRGPNRHGPDPLAEAA